MPSRGGRRSRDVVRIVESTAAAAGRRGRAGAGSAGAASDEDETWDDVHRSRIRVKRLEARRPTGHPAMVAKLLRLRQSLEAANDDSSEGTAESEREGDGAGRGRGAAGSGSNSGSSGASEGEGRSESGSDADSAASGEGGARDDGRKRAKTRFCVVDASAAPARAERATRGRCGDDRRGERPRDPRPSGRPAGGKSGAGGRHARLVVTPSEIAGRADDRASAEWAQRHQERAQRISRRHPTGHPLVGAKAANLLRQLRDLDQDDGESGSEEAARGDTAGDAGGEIAFRPRRRGGGGGGVGDSADFKRPDGPPARSRGSVKIGQREVIRSETDSGEGERWEERAGERASRIRQRKATGHPRLSERVADLVQELDEQGRARRRGGSSSDGGSGRSDSADGSADSDAASDDSAGVEGGFRPRAVGAGATKKHREGRSRGRPSEPAAPAAAAAPTSHKRDRDRDRERERDRNRERERHRVLASGGGGSASKVLSPPKLPHPSRRSARHSAALDEAAAVGRVRISRTPEVVPDEDGDDSWEETERRERRRSRIQGRKSTAHMNLGPMVKKMLRELATEEAEELEIAGSLDAAPAHGKGHKRGDGRSEEKAFASAKGRRSRDSADGARAEGPRASALKHSSKNSSSGDKRR